MSEVTNPTKYIQTTRKTCYLSLNTTFSEWGGFGSLPTRTENKSFLLVEKGFIKMSENKKYFYLKLKDSFFSSEEMMMLESLPDGLVYQNIYLRMCLLSLKNDGALTFKNMIPYDLQMLSTVLRIDIAKMKMAIELFEKLGLITKTDNEVLFMSDIQTLIGKSSTEAERIASYRRRIAGCTKSVQMLQSCTPELEIELELKKDYSCSTQQQPFQKPTIKEIADYCAERKNKIDPAYFFDYYETKGWKIGKALMTDWKACIRNWERKDPAEAPKEEKEYIMVCEICGHKFEFNNDWECPQCHSKKIAIGEKKKGE